MIAVVSTLIDCKPGRLVNQPSNIRSTYLYTFSHSQRLYWITFGQHSAMSATTYGIQGKLVVVKWQVSGAFD